MMAPKQSALALWAFASLLLAGLLAGCPTQATRPPTCGNGVVEGREECDDGNQQPGDGCSPLCLREAGEICANYEDDDGDGLADCADPDCQGDPSCFEPLENCNNSTDDDGDGLVDCDDPDCQHTSFCRKPEDCSNNLDDDDDGLTDCDDPDCSQQPRCGACPADTDLDAIAPGDATDWIVDLAHASRKGVSTCPTDQGFEGQLRFSVSVPFHLWADTTATAGLGLEQETAPNESCDLFLWRCVDVPSQDTSLHIHHLPPGTYRLAVKGDGGQGEITVSVRIEDGTVEQDCDDGLDDDRDGLTDCDDSDCATALACATEDCDNGLDDDGDGKTDCADSDCATWPACLPPENCGNGLDDDDDGKTDCADLDCTGSASCQGSDCVTNHHLGSLRRGDEATWAFDSTLGVDLGATSCAHPGDREVVADFILLHRAIVRMHMTQTGYHVLALDTEAGSGTWCDAAELSCTDPQGLGLPIQVAYKLPAARYFVLVEATSQAATGQGLVTVDVSDPTQELCDDGLDDDDDGLTDCADPDCATSPVCLPETICHDGLDDDNDGLTDCADPDCVGTDACLGGSCQADRDLGTVTDTHPLYVYGDTTGAQDRYSASCSPSGGPDRVYAFTLDQAGGIVVRVSQDPGADHVLALVTQGGPMSTCDTWQYSCSDSGGPGLPIVVTVDTLPPGTYFLLVDTYEPTGMGGFQIQVNRR